HQAIDIGQSLGGYCFFDGRVRGEHDQPAALLVIDRYSITIVAHRSMVGDVRYGVASSTALAVEVDARVTDKQLHRVVERVLFHPFKTHFFDDVERLAGSPIGEPALVADVRWRRDLDVGITHRSEHQVTDDRLAITGHALDERRPANLVTGALDVVGEPLQQ